MSWRGPSAVGHVCAPLLRLRANLVPLLCKTAQGFPKSKLCSSQERQGALFIKQGLYKGAVFKPRARE